MQKHTRLLGTLSLALAVAFAGACATSYSPKGLRGRIATVWKNGEVAYVRDGKTYSRGLWGKGLISAVEGVPMAEAAARSSYRRAALGTVLTATGLLCGLVVLAVADEMNEGESNGALLATGACMLGVSGGLATTMSAAPYTQDAINIFNDSVASAESPEAEHARIGKPETDIDEAAGSR